MCSWLNLHELNRKMRKVHSKYKLITYDVTVLGVVDKKEHKMINNSESSLFPNQDYLMFYLVLTTTLPGSSYYDPLLLVL